MAVFPSEAGFSEEWASTSEERTRQRQVEVQANVANNPNRPTEYRIVTTPPAQTQNPEQEAEERMSDCNPLILSPNTLQSNKKKHLMLKFQAALNWDWVISFSTRFSLEKHQAMAIGIQPLHVLLPF